MRGEPNGAKKQGDAEKQLRTYGNTALKRRFDGGDPKRGADKNDHSAQGERDNQKSGDEKEANELHDRTPKE